MLQLADRIAVLQRRRRDGAGATEEPVKRRLAAIAAADVVGYSRLMGADEVGTLRAMRAHRLTAAANKTAGARC